VSAVSGDVHTPTDAGPVETGPAFEAPAAAATPSSTASPLDRPEVQLGAAFAGGFVLAMIIKRLGS